jgi:putative redox protein
MKDSINVKWVGNMAFEAAVGNHTILLDAKHDVGGNDSGPRPKALTMVSLAGCTGMDVISILKKMKVDVKEFNVGVEAELTEEHPKHFTAMHVVYEFVGDHLQEDKLRRAIELSQDKYCGVSASLRKAMNLTWEIRIIQQP